MANPFINSSNTTYDLTDPDVNSGAVNQATPREGGFVLRNRMNFTNITAPTCIAGKIANVLKILKVPKRTVIRELRFHAIRGATAPTHGITLGSSAASSAASGATMGVGGIWYTDASQTASSAVTDVDALADHAITKSTGVCAGMPTLDASGVIMTDYTEQSDTVAPVLPFTFPYGGWIQMGIVAGGNNASDLTGAFAGTLEVRAVCDYIPE